MLKIRAFYLLLLCTLVFSACNKGEKYDAEVQLIADDKLITDFLIKNNIQATKHSSGIYYEIIDAGSGISATASTAVTVKYEGRLLNGTVFDKTTDQPVTFQLGQVITGWQIGIPLIKKGGKIRLIIPSYYAYQNASPGAGIPVNAVLDFTIEVVNIQ